jgi:hypothetical protein
MHENLDCLPWQILGEIAAQERGARGFTELGGAHWSVICWVAEKDLHSHRLAEISSVVSCMNNPKESMIRTLGWVAFVQKATTQLGWGGEGGGGGGIMPSMYSWKSIGPVVVSALKFGTISVRRTILYSDAEKLQA